VARPERATRHSNFADRLSSAVAERQSQIALGLDPDPLRLLPRAVEKSGEGTPAERAGRAVAAHCRSLIEEVAPACVAVKLQLACFERLRAPGWQAFQEVVSAAREAGLLVIADGKRGDVPHTAAVYAESMFGPTATPWGDEPEVGVDAITINPLLGRDALEPFVESARSSGGGTFVLVRTSNPGAGELQDAKLGDAPLHVALARMVAELGAGGVGECGLSDVGAVVGATQSNLIDELREQMPQAVFLLPGVGAQGGRVEDLRAAFTPGKAAALVTAARSIVGPALESGDPRAARSSAERLRDASWEAT
jgi:orotidine-5'-phosphate decarboxylase